MLLAQQILSKIRESLVTVFVVALLQNGLTDFNKIVFVYLVDMRIGRKIFFTLLVPTQRGVQTRILKFTVDSLFINGC